MLSTDALIQSVNTNGNVIAERGIATRTVAAGDVWTADVTLEANGLSEDHSEMIITVDQYDELSPDAPVLSLLFSEN